MPAANLTLAAMRESATTQCGFDRNGDDLLASTDGATSKLPLTAATLAKNFRRFTRYL